MNCIGVGEICYSRRVTLLDRGVQDVLWHSQRIPLKIWTRGKYLSFFKAKHFHIVTFKSVDCKASKLFGSVAAKEKIYQVIIVVVKVVCHSQVR